MAHQALRRRADAIRLDNPDLWGARVSIAGGPWYQLLHPRVQHLVHESLLPMDEEDDDDDMRDTLLNDGANVSLYPRLPAPRLYHHKAAREGFHDEAQYWLHLTQDDASAVELVFDVPQETLCEDCPNPLRWRIGDPQPCVVEFVMRLPMHELTLRKENALMNLEFSMSYATHPSEGKPHHYLMVLLATDNSAEMEFQSRLDVATRSAFYFHPTRFAVQIRTDALVFAMAVRNQWFKNYLQGLGVLPEDDV